jgi:UDP-galactopyranose mutase
VQGFSLTWHSVQFGSFKTEKNESKKLGLFGSVCARELTDRGFRCLVVDKRAHIGGNIYTERVEGIDVHKYGAHIFHTNDEGIWKYVNRFATFNNYRHKVFVRHRERLFSFPINLLTLHQLWGVCTPAEALERMQAERIALSGSTENLEAWIMSQVGTELYEIFIKGYTAKQWGRAPHLLPSSIIKRIPIRNHFDDFYFNDAYQGIPREGYTHLGEQLLKGVDLRLNTDFFLDRSELERISTKIIYTGPIDQLLGYKYGPLEYRSLRFEHQTLDQPDFQGTAVVNYTEERVPYTRILEHKHFNFGTQQRTVITREFPSNWSRGMEPYYPINDEANGQLFKLYREDVAHNYAQYILGGRLAEYRYYDMHQVIGSALTKVKKLLGA